MCYLLFKPKGQEIKTAWLVNAYNNGNVDGCGFAYYKADGELVAVRSLSLSAFLKDAERVPADVDAVFHLRMASTGEVSLANCHPFAVGDFVAAHNGCLAGYGSKEMTDTEDFLWREVCSHAELVANQAALSAQIGFGKMVFLSANTSPVILNEKLGQWSDGCWHSNSYYQAGRWGFGYLGHDDEAVAVEQDEEPPLDPLERLLFALDEADDARPPRDIKRAIARLRELVETRIYSTY